MTRCYWSLQRVSQKPRHIARLRAQLMEKITRKILVARVISHYRHGKQIAKKFCSR